MFISNITFSNRLLYVSGIAKVSYTLTWWWPFDSDISFQNGLRCSIIENVVYHVKSCNNVIQHLPYSLSEIKYFEFELTILRDYKPGLMPRIGTNFNTLCQN